MEKRDYYDVLGVSKNASKDEIKKKYRKIAVANHPDTHPDDKEAEARFKEATEAYEILSDDDKRKTYDQFGFEGVNGQATGWTNARNDFADIFSHFGDIFGFSGFGQQSNRNFIHPGQDMNINMNASYKDVYVGIDKKIKYKKNVRCHVCNGVGGKKEVSCPDCHGTGQVRSMQGFMTMITTCPHCRGTGKSVLDICNCCNGSGFEQKEEEINVTIPKGFPNMYRLRKPYAGCESKNTSGQNGDLYITVNVVDDSYERNNSDIFKQCEISALKACTGCEQEITTLDGKKIKVHIPDGTQFGDSLKISGKGLPIMNSNSYGDLYLYIKTVIPKLTEEQKNIIRQIETQ